MKIKRVFKREEIKDEFRIWTQFAKPALIELGVNLPDNVLNICEYGFTEVLNNAIDHSDGFNVELEVNQLDKSTNLTIIDDGVGLFSKLRNYFGFDNEIHALIELVKGKLTVAPEAHSGEGLFFCSKMFNQFLIQSGKLSVIFEGDTCIVNTLPVARTGTLIAMTIANDSKTTSKDIFDKFCDSEELTFYKTRFFLSLAALEGNLISRSQAKRVSARFDSFSEVELNFSGVDTIGQAFADELIRVWSINHPKTKLTITNANNNVIKMINHIKSRTDLPQPA